MRFNNVAYVCRCLLTLASYDEYIKVDAVARCSFHYNQLIQSPFFTAVSNSMTDIPHLNRKVNESIKSKSNAITVHSQIPILMDFQLKLIRFPLL